MERGRQSQKTNTAGYSQLLNRICCCTGMAGSGKTTLMQRMAAHLNHAGKPAYVLNLDPAVTNVPYGANIDIRDTVCVLPKLSDMSLC